MYFIYVLNITKLFNFLIFLVRQCINFLNITSKMT